jgi:NAD(P)-dependent dehydrogenase (short-subunit alcohol dehydrogenase family)
VGDLSSKAGCVAVCAEIKKRFQKIHVLVNNAGTILSAPFNDVPEKGKQSSPYSLFLITCYSVFFKLMIGMAALGAFHRRLG